MSTLVEPFKSNKRRSRSQSKRPDFQKYLSTDRLPGRIHPSPTHSGPRLPSKSLQGRPIQLGSSASIAKHEAVAVSPLQISRCHALHFSSLLPASLFRPLPNCCRAARSRAAPSRSAHRPDSPYPGTSPFHPRNRSLARWQPDCLERSGPKGGIQVAPLNDPAHPRQITACAADAKGTESGIAWSPDSKHLAFFSNCTADHKAAIFLAEPASNARPHLLAHAQRLRQRPALVARRQIPQLSLCRRSHPPSGALAAMKPPSGVIGVEGLEVQRVAAVDASQRPAHSDHPRQPSRLRIRLVG